MAVEFDKEIDALLRKARGIDPAAGGGHLDADEIAAFVENALPAMARQNFTTHLAECSRCRRILTVAMEVNEIEADVAIAAPVVETPETRWYSKLFRFPALSYALGGLVLVFGGLFVFSVLRTSDRLGEVSQTFNNSEVPEMSRAANTANANVGLPANLAPSSSANSVVPANTSAARSDESSPVAPVPMATPDVTSTGNLSKEPVVQPQSESKAALEERNQTVIKKEEVPVGSTEQPVAKQSKPVPKDTMADKDDQETDTKLSDAAGATRDEKAKTATVARKRGETTETRTVGGKSFRNIGGIWFDAAYNSSQSQIQIKRGSDDYRKLDSGLRSIADQLGGTVVIVWNGKTYKIS